MDLNWYFINTDGGSRGNPGPSAAGVVIKNNAGKLQELCGKYLGIGTNNEAEYLAVLLAYEQLFAKKVDPEKTGLKFFLDSQLVVNQLNGVYKIKEPRLQNFITKIKEHSVQFAQVSYNYVPREQNKEADKVVNEYLNARAKRTY